MKTVRRRERERERDSTYFPPHAAFVHPLVRDVNVIEHIITVIVIVIIVRVYLWATAANERARAFRGHAQCHARAVIGHRQSAEHTRLFTKTTKPHISRALAYRSEHICVLNTTIRLVALTAARPALDKRLYVAVECYTKVDTLRCQQKRTAQIASHPHFN